MTTTFRKTKYFALMLIGIFSMAIAHSAIAQEAKPQETKGISIGGYKTLNLGGQIPALKDYAMQIRMIVLKPGAVAGYHSHAKRPVVAYLVSGDYTEHRDGQGVVTHKPGEQWVEGADVAHWSENRGSETTYLINVEVFSTK